MENQAYDRLITKYLYTLRECEEMLNWWEREIAKFECQLNSRKELSRFKEVQVASSSKQATASGLVIETPEALINGFDYLRCTIDTTCRQREIHRINLDAHRSNSNILQENPRGLITNKTVNAWHASCSRNKDCSSKNMAKRVLEVGEFEHLNQRLKILEGEMQIMKQAFLAHVKERRKLVYEIYQKFRVIQHKLYQSMMTH